MNPQTWFRFYNEVVDDPKVQRLAPAVFKNWVNFMCIASKYGGVLPETRDIAYKLRVTEMRAEAMLKVLIDANLFEWTDGVCHPHNWQHRQFKSDCSTDRVKRFRNVGRNVSGTPDETLSTEQTITETEQTPKAPAGGELEYPADFLEYLWEPYPKKREKLEALKVWRKLRPSQTVKEKIRDAILAASKSWDWLKEDGQFIPSPAKWLRRGNWENEIKAQAASARPGGVVM